MEADHSVEDKVEDKVEQNPSIPKELSFQLKTEKYSAQRNNWPLRGKHILAQFNDQGILVYQAYSNEIAEYAIANQKFGGPGWNSTRMTWIKTNFLWMMFRSNWAQKKYQERILGIWLKKEAFEKYLAWAGPTSGKIRLQWDPDHYPDGSRHLYRKAIQLGVKLKSVPSFGDASDFICIIDVTEFVQSQWAAVKAKNWESLVTPQERVYTVSDPQIAQHIGVDSMGK